MMSCVPLLAQCVWHVGLVVSLACYLGAYVAFGLWPAELLLLLQEGQCISVTAWQQASHRVTLTGIASRPL